MDDDPLLGYRELYGLAETDFLPGAAGRPGERAVVEEAARDYDRDRHDAFEIRAAECALLVIDMQEDFVRPSSVMWMPQAQRAVPAIAALATACRAVGAPVLFTEATYLQGHPNDTARYCAPIRDGLLAEGSGGVRVVEELYEKGEYVVRTKYSYDAFFETELDARLRARGVRTVIVCGTMTNYCCEATARGAFDRGYHVVFGDDVTATDTASGHRATVRTLRRGYARVIDGSQIARALAGDDELYRRAATAG